MDKDNIKSEQIEAVITAADYCKKLATAIDNLAYELENGRLDDTEQYAREILDGINWVIQVYNATKGMLGEIGVVIDENKINEAIKNFVTAYDNNDDESKAQILRGAILDFINDMILAGAKLN